MNRQAILHSILYVTLFIFFTLFFMSVNYPSERLTGQVNGWLWATSEGALTVRNARIKPLLSLEMGGLTLHVSQERSVDMGEAVADVRFLSLLSGKKGADVRIENPWLNSSLAFISAGKGWDLDARSVEIDLSELPDDIMTLPLSFEGKIGGSLYLFSNDRSKGISSGEVGVTSGPIVISGDLLESLGLEPLRISRVLAAATLKENVLTLGENAIEGDFTVIARGVIKIAFDNYMTSRLDLTVELNPGPGIREKLMPLLALMGARPKADGSINIRVRGTLGKPSITM